MTTFTEKALLYNDTDESLASIVKRLGNPISTLLLQSSCDIFRIPEIDGVIGYQIVRNCAVVFGDPICLPENIAELTEAFHLYCKQNNLRIVYFLASDSFSHWAIQNGCHTLIQVAEELVIDPTKFRKKQKLRWKINQSILHGVNVKEYKGYDPVLEKQMRETIKDWSNTKNGPQIYLGDLKFFLQDDKRIFYATLNDEIVGVLTLSPVDQFQGWVINFYFAVSDAPVGTSENLMSTAFETLARENCHFLCLGAVSGSALGEIVGLNYFSKLLAHLIFKISKKLFNLDAKKIYLNKYQPYTLPFYCLFSGKLSFIELIALKNVLNVKL